MIRFAPILLAVLTAFAMYYFSAWRTKRDLTARSTPLDDPELERMTRKMAQALDLPRVSVNVYEIEPVNGLAAPDGRIFITRGFLNRYKSGEITAEELASVIAHELGHVALGHTKRRMIDFGGQNALRTVLAMVLSRFIPFVGAYIANFLVGLLAARMSQSDEYEADEYAAALMTKSGIGLSAQISMFEKLDAWSTAHKGATPAWMMSHPKTTDRIKALQKLEQKWQVET
ncbi:MAG: M48 family metallopeptidase [Pelagimonas sp.]|jgi:putative metalloprotease|nr:M48 family metallopeptidase [Pelagimonas sp.]